MSDKSSPQPQPLLNRFGEPVRVKRIPMSTGRKKFKHAKVEDNLRSPFERFESKGGSKVRSF
jgi:uncharacterized protein YcgL (UPF0745 family)